jgi:hypothetical protein
MWSYRLCPKQRFAGTLKNILNDKDSDNNDVNNNVTIRQDSGHVTFYFIIPLFPQHIEYSNYCLLIL